MTAWKRESLIRGMVLLLAVGMVFGGFTGADARPRRGEVSQTAAEQGSNAHIVSFGLFGPQSVFESEAKGAARIMTAYFRTPYPAIVRYNSKRVSQIGPTTLSNALRTAGRSMDPERDILVLFLTSHGSPDGLAAVSRNGAGTMSPSGVGGLLDASGARYRILIVSACYSGVFADALADRNTLVITAADSRHSSFGCADGVRWTYFGQAFFAESLRRGATLQQAFASARQRIRAREKSLGQTASNPQFRGGEAVLALLGQ